MLAHFFSIVQVYGCADSFFDKELGVSCQWFVHLSSFFLCLQVVSINRTLVERGFAQWVDNYQQCPRCLDNLFLTGKKKSCFALLQFGLATSYRKICLHLHTEFCGPLKLVLLNCYHFTRNTYLISVKGRVLKAIMRDTVALKQKILPGLYSKIEWKKTHRTLGLA